MTVTRDTAIEWRGRTLESEIVGEHRTWYGTSAFGKLPFVAVMVWGGERLEAVYRPDGKSGWKVTGKRFPGETHRAACLRMLDELAIAVDAFAPNEARGSA